MDDDFDTFWAAYPRRQAKGDARKAWQQTAAIRPPIDEVLKAILAHRRSEQWRKDGGQFIPMPATWLRQERWEDAPAEVYNERADQIAKLAKEREQQQEKTPMPDNIRQMYVKK